MTGRAAGRLAPCLGLRLTGSRGHVSGSPLLGAKAHARTQRHLASEGSLPGAAASRVADFRTSVAGYFSTRAGKKINALLYRALRTSEGYAHDYASWRHRCRAFKRS